MEQKKSKEKKYTADKTAGKPKFLKGNAERTDFGKDRSKKEQPVKEMAVKETGCKLAGKCGGCQLSAMPYEKQLAKKQKYVKELLEQFGTVEKIIGMKNPLHYRNKVSAAFDRDRRGNIISGVYEAGSHRVVPVEKCMLENKKADEIIGSIRKLAKSFKIRIFDEDTGYGLLRHVLIRTGHTTGEIMVVLVTASPVFPSKNNFVKALRELHPEITTVIQNVNNRNTSMVLGDKEHVLYGKGYIEDTLCGKKFRISPLSFYQINSVQTEILYSTAVSFAGLTGRETVLDAYCGTGPIGLIASDRADKVIGVELNRDAVRDAVINAKQNDRKNVTFYKNDAGVFMCQLAEQKQHVDVVFMDPPRAGSDESFLGAVCTLKPDKVVYVSCNPETLQRDLEFLTKRGYQVKKIQPVDMFPMTGHVETIVALHRTNS